MAHDNPQTLTKAELAQFTGTEYWYSHSLNRNITYTDGARYVAQAGGAYWLLDELALTQIGKPAVAALPFQVWKLTVSEDHTAVLTCEDGNDKVVYAKEIAFTDFPLDEITLWFTDNVILLPSEY